MLGTMGGQGNSLQNSSAATATSGDASNGSSTGAKTFNFNAPAQPFTQSLFGKGVAAAVLLMLFVLAAVWVKGKKRR